MDQATRFDLNSPSKKTTGTAFIYAAPVVGMRMLYLRSRSILESAELAAASLIVTVGRQHDFIGLRL